MSSANHFEKFIVNTNKALAIKVDEQTCLKGVGENPVFTVVTMHQIKWDIFPSKITLFCRSFICSLFFNASILELLFRWTFLKKINEKIEEK